MKKRIASLKRGDTVSALPYATDVKFPAVVHAVLAARSRGYRLVEVVDAADRLRLVAVGHESGLAEVVE